MEIEISGGATIVLPDDADEAAVQKAIRHFRSTPEFDALVDKSRGAPAGVRLAVGSARTPEDRLATIRQYFRDAVPYGDDNFVFTDPETNRPTLYNPKGLDVGDVASAAREIVVGGYSTLGAIYGGAGGTLMQPGVGTAAGAAYGAGFGAMAGGQLFDIAAEILLRRPDSRDVGGRMLDAALDFGAAAAGQRAGELAETGIKRALVPAGNAARSLARAFESLRIKPSPGAVSRGRVLQTVEKGLESSPASADVMQRHAEAILAQTKAAAERVAGTFGRAQTPQGAGGVMKEAARRVAERFGFRQGELYDEAWDLIGADTLVPVATARQLLATMETELARAPQALGRALRPAINTLRNISDDAGLDGIAFGALRQIRTAIGKEIDAPLLVGSSGARNEGLKRIYAALTLDMSSAARAAGPDAARNLARADRYTRMFMTTAADTMKKINNFDAEERAFVFAVNSARDGGTILARLRRHFTPEEWDTVAASVLHRLGRATSGRQDAAGEAFSVSTFLTNWDRLAPEAKQALFGGRRYADLMPELDNLVRVISSLKEVERLANTSNTARAMIVYGTMQTLGGVVGGLFLGGDTNSAIAGALGVFVAPRVAAKLITSPSFVRWLTTPVTSPSGIAAHLGRLAAIGVAEPEIRNEIQQYLTALRAIPATSRQRSRATVRGIQGTPAEADLPPQGPSGAPSSP